MQKKVLILSASLRNGSNSHALAQQFAKGAQEAGHEVELISLAGNFLTSPVAPGFSRYSKPVLVSVLSSLQPSMKLPIIFRYAGEKHGE